MARSFNGTSDQIAISGVATPTTAVSVSVWVNPSSFPNAYNTVIGPASAAPSFWQIHVKSTGQLAMYVDTVTGGGRFFDPGSHTLSTGTWYNLILTYDTVNGVAGYVNNASDGTGLTGSNIVSTAGATFGIGYDPANSGRNFSGLIAEGAAWNILLTAGERAALTAGALPKDIRPGSLLGYWPLYGLASPEPDFSGFAHNGTLTGTAKAAGPPVMMATPRWPQFPIQAIPQVLMPQACL